jgi:FMN phosphatase YigB (HAD superfamily)
MLSDTDPLHFQHLISRFPLVRRFSHYFLSYVTGCLKTDPAAFVPVLERCDPARDEILFVDDIRANVEVAQETGIPAMQFTGWPDVAVRLQTGPAAP